MKIYKDQMVAVESQYGMAFYVAETDSDEYGEFLACDQDGDSIVISVNEVAHAYEYTLSPTVK